MGRLVTGAVTKGSFRSIVPPLIPPLPSAVRVPTIVKKPKPESLPVTEKTYVPFKSLLVKFPVGGGGMTCEMPPPPQAPRIARLEKMMGRTKRLRKNMTSPWVNCCGADSFDRASTVALPLDSTRIQRISSGESGRFRSLYILLGLRGGISDCHPRMIQGDSASQMHLRSLSGQAPQ